MLRLRPYKPCDAKHITSWIKDEVSFRKWCSTRLDSYPIGENDLNAFYNSSAYNDTEWAMTAFDESGIVGHLTMRFTDEQKHTIRLGFIIVDASKRGKGYGKEMLHLASKYAFEILKVKKITLGVFDNNPGAYYCYRSAGFTESLVDEPCYRDILGERWHNIEMEKRVESF